MNYGRNNPFFLYYIFIRLYYTKLGQVVYLSDIDSNGMKASFYGK